MIRALAVAALVVSLVPGVSVSQCSDADKAALIAFDKAWGDASTNGDAAALGGYLSDGFSGMNLFTTTDKATTIAASVKSAADAKQNPPTRTASPDRFVISCTPTTATITHRTVSTPVAGGSGPVNYSRAIHVLEKRGKNWQAVASLGSAVSEPQQLVYLEMDWNDALKSHDVAWVEKTYAPFATDVSSLTGAISNTAQAIESARNDKRTIESLELSELTTRVEGDVGVVTGVNHVKGKDGRGKPFDRKVRFTDVFLKRDGRWMVWATQGTEIR